MTASSLNEPIEIVTVHRYLQEWRKRCATDCRTKSLDEGIATVFNIYREFISNGFKWEQPIPVLTPDVDYMAETLTASTILSLRIARDGMRYCATHLAGEQDINLPTRLKEWKRLNEFARRLNSDLSTQISAHMQCNRLAEAEKMLEFPLSDVFASFRMVRPSSSVLASTV
jgi:hypothetical protein